MSKSKTVAPPKGAAAKAAPTLIARDIALVLALPFLCLLAWLTPDRLQLAAARALSQTILWLAPEAVERKMRRLSPTFAMTDYRTLYTNVVTVIYFELLQLLRYHLPLSRPPAVELEGEEHLADAYKNGKGAILWVAPTTFAPMLTKVALKNRGFDIWHLSRPTHGSSPSKFGQKFLNPIRIEAESKFLAERIVIQNGRTRPAIERIVECLRLNRLVSITVGAQAKAVQEVPFVTGTMTVALRPVDLARQSGALLLPVITIRDKNGEATVRVGAPLPVENDDDAVRALAAFLEPYGREYPEQFAQASIFWPTEFVKRGPAAATV